MAVSETSEGPVLNLINKRLRALRKKFNRILQMEQSLATGKILNKEQEETFRSKPAVVAAIDELEKLRQPLSSAVAEEINLATQHNNDGISMVEDLLNVIYFGNMFDHVKLGQGKFLMERAMHERGCCLNYDCMLEDESTTDVIDLLSEKDLDLISMLSGLLISRPVNSTSSHKHALQSCFEHAKLWVTKSDQHIAPESDITYAGLRTKLNKIMSSLYFTTDPVFRGENVVAASGSYLAPEEKTAGAVPVDEAVPVEETVGVVPVNEIVQIDTLAVQHQEKEDEYVSSQARSNEMHDSFVEELHEGEQNEKENLSEQPAEPDQVGRQGEVVENLKDETPNDQQSVPRRSYQGYRGNRGGGGGGRRGYPNGRGGRGRGWSYQNERNTYSDQSSNYYPKNHNNYRGRGGRGGRGGGNYSNYASGGQAGNIAAVS